MSSEIGMLVLAASVPAALMGLLLWLAARIRPRRTGRRSVACPARGHDAAVDVVFADDEHDAWADVVHCSLVPEDGAIACGKPCRSISVAPFGVARLTP